MLTNNNIKIIFMGTPEFAIPSLKSLLENNYKIIAVITAPDKAVGRKQILKSPPVKIEAEKNNILVLQPERIREQKWIEKIKELNPDLIVVCAYGQIIPKEIFNIPKFGSINIHPSLLPKYRGASPIQYTILNNETETGVTLILLDEEIDHGPILSSAKYQIPNSKITYVELNRKLAELGAQLLIETLPKWLNKEIIPQEQNHRQATFTKIIKKEDGKIDWSESAEKIDAKIRAFNPWPGAYSILDGKILKILEGEAIKEMDKSLENLPLGTIFKANNDILIKCGSGALKIKNLQLEGKKPMNIKTFLNGYSRFIGSTLK